MQRFIKKRSFVILVSIAILLFATFFFINLKIKGIVESQLEQALNANKSKNYTVRFQRLKINWLTSSLILKGVSIIPDSNMFTESHSGDSAFFALRINIKAFRIRNINIKKALQKIADIDEIVIEKPDITLYKYTPPQRKKKKSRPNTVQLFNTDSLYFSHFTSLKLNRILLKKLNFRFKNLNDTTGKKEIYINNFTLEAKDIDIVPLAEGSHFFKLTIGDYSIGAQRNELLIPGEKYKIAFRQININKKHKTLVVDHLQLIPLKQKIRRIAAKSKYSIETYSVTIPLLEVENINTDRFSFFTASKITLSGASIYIFKEKNKGNHPDKRPLFPTQILRQTAYPFNIDTLLIKNAFLEYTEHAKQKDSNLKVTLNQIEATVYNITSFKEKMDAGDTMTIFFNAKLLKKIPVEITLHMPVKSNRFMVQGSLGRGSLLTLNRITKPAGLVFSGGRLNGLKFRAHANTTTAWGTLTMHYKDLHVNILNSDKTDKKGMFSWLANGIIRNSNPTNGNLRKGTIFFERKNNKGFPNFIIGTLLSGVKATIIPTVEKTNRKKVDEYLGISKETRKALNKKKRKEKKGT